MSRSKKWRLEWAFFLGENGSSILASSFRISARSTGEILFGFCFRTPI